MSTPSVAMIGSFRKHLDKMEEATEVFSNHGIEVVNPLGTESLEPGIEFVRLASDDPELSDAAVQLKALERILGASAVYVVCPDGYVGRTTSYEWGWVEGRERPAYFSEEPEHRSMRMYSEERVITPHDLSHLILNSEVEPINPRIVL